MLKYVFLLIGFVFLIKGADFFVEGSSSVAKILKVPSIIIGLTIVAMGTSAPELAVSVSAGLAGQNEIAVSNVIGSNMFNLLVIGGLCAMIQGMKVDRDILRRDFPIAIGAGVLLLIMTMDQLFKGNINLGSFDFSGTAKVGNVGRVDGIILLVLFAGYMYILVKNTLKDRNSASVVQEEIEEVEEIKVLSVPLSIVYIIGGALVIVAGGQLVVNSASDIAASFGMSQTLIGLTVCAVGTSLPELVTSLVAMKKGENELALGNIMGSCVFNILFVLALSAALNPIAVTMVNVYDMVFLAVTSLFMYACAATKKNVNRIEGSILLILYIAYMAYVVVR